MTFAADLDDNLDDIFGASTPADVEAGYRLATEGAQMKMHEATCKKCRGRGRFIGYTGRDLGQCFTCKGKGVQFFRTSIAQREHAKALTTDRKERNVNAWREAHADVVAWIDEVAPRFEFAASMRDAIAKYGHLTERQLSACENAAAKSAARKAEWAARDAAKVEAAPSISVAAIEAAFDTARDNGLKRLSLRLDEYKFKPASETGRNAGSIYVTSLSRTDSAGEAAYLGKITDGKFFSARNCSADDEARIIAAAIDPKAAAVAYGKRTGSCCICARELTNAESVALGIGPICAGKYAF